MAIEETQTTGTSKMLGRTAPKETRRLQLIQATIDSISQNGVSGTTMKAVTGIAGLSMGIVNFHFQNKETLFHETLRFLGEEHRDRWRRNIEQSSLRPEDKLTSIVEAHFHPDICNRRKLSVWFGFYGEAGYRASYRKIMSEIDDERWKISAGLISEIIEDGGYQGIVAEEVSDTLEGLYDGFCLNILMYPGTFTRIHAKARTLDYLAGVFPHHFQHSAS
jgi:TetR/AcrR family transcriptional repressor of bet genes